MARILVVEPVALLGFDVLTAAHETEVRLGLSRDELLRLLAEGGGYDAIIVRSQTRKLCSRTGPQDAREEARNTCRSRARSSGCSRRTAFLRLPESLTFKPC